MNPNAMERMDTKSGGYEPNEGDKKEIYRSLSA